MSKVEQNAPLTCFMAYDVLDNVRGLEQKLAELSMMIKGK